MIKSILVLYLLYTLFGCENNEGQYRHDKNHHKKIQNWVSLSNYSTKLSTNYGVITP